MAFSVTFLVIAATAIWALLSSPVYSISFVRYPADVTVHEGEDATFHCTVTDKGDTHVYWQKNKSVYLSRDRNVTMYAPIHPALTARLHVVGLRKNPGKFSLRIHGVNRRDQGIYQCVYFQNMFSYYSPEARLTVLPRRPPSLACSSDIFWRQNGNNLWTTLTGIIGSNMQLICEESFTGGAQRNLSSLYWYKSGEEQRLLQPQYCIIYTSDRQKCVYAKPLSIDDLDVSYSCAATSSQGVPMTGNSCQTTPFPSTITVTVSPSVLTHEMVGGNATFTCATSSSSASVAANPQFRWYLNGQPIQQEKDDGTIQPWNKPRLTLDNINLADNGTELTCVLFGDNGTLGKGSGVLLVQGNYTVTTDDGHTPATTITTTTHSADDTSVDAYVSRNTSGAVVRRHFNDTGDNTSGASTVTTLSNDRNMTTVTASPAYDDGVYSPRNDTGPDPAVTDIATTTNKLPVDNPFLNLSLNDFPMVVAASALVFAAMCLLVLFNVTCYIVYKKHRNYKHRRYTLAQIRPGLNDSILLDQLSPKTRQKYTKQQSVSSFYSESEGTRSSSQLKDCLVFQGQTKQSNKTADSSCSDIGEGTGFWISSDSDTLPKYRDEDLPPKYKSKKTKSSGTGSASSAPPPNVQYRVIDPLRSDSLIDSVKQQEVEVHVEPKMVRKLRDRTPSSSSESEDKINSLRPRYLEQLDAHRAWSLNTGVVPPWHKQPPDTQETPAYAVCNLLGGGKIPLSKSFCANRPRPMSHHQISHSRISTRSLQDYAKRSSNIPTLAMDTKYDNRRPLRSPRPTSEGFDYDNHRPTHSPRRTSEGSQYDNHRSTRSPRPTSDGSQYDNHRSQYSPRTTSEGYDDNIRSPRRSSDGSQYDNFKSATAVGVTLIPDINVPDGDPGDVGGKVNRHQRSRRHSFSSVESRDPPELEWDTSPCAHNLAVRRGMLTRNLSYSDPELDHHTSGGDMFFPEQSLPVTPSSPGDTEFFFDDGYDKMKNDYLSVEGAAEGEGGRRRQHFLQRQRSFSDSCPVNPMCALDVINESSFNNSTEPISSASSEGKLDDISPQRSPVPPPRRVHDKVVYRQRHITNRPRPTSEPIRVDFDFDPNSTTSGATRARAAADDKSLVLFPPFR